MTELTPPIAEKRPYPLTIHDDTRIDNYYWLREKESVDVLAYLKAENAFTQAKMAHTESLQQKLYEEMVGRIQETDSSVPVRKGNYFYYSRTEEGKQYAIHCRKKGALDAPEEILIDENSLAEGHDYFNLGTFEVSPNEQILAYATDTQGGERYTTFFKDLTTGELLPDHIEESGYSAVWANDNQTYFYTVQDDAWREHRVMRHELGKADDTLIYQEDDALFQVYIDKTKDKAYLILTISSIESSEALYLDANNPLGTFTLVHPRQERVQYYLDHRQGVFYIRTNENAPNYQLMKVSVERPSKENWQSFYGPFDDRYFEGMDLFATHMVIYGRFDGLRAMQIYDFRESKLYDLSFPEPVYSYSRSSNPEVNSETVRIIYQSLTTSDATYDINLETLDWKLLKREPVLGDYDPENYITERHFATASDGTQIPISLVYKKGIELNSNTPCLLYGYGSYGANMEPRFDQKRLCLIDRGFVYALAHIRGGQEMGRYWYDQGKWLNKKNTFTDFIACAEHLIAQHYTSTERLVINGRSAGGLLMGAVTTMRPDLCKAVVAGVPFVDVVTTMLDESIPLTVGEYDEWGNPNYKQYYDYMLSYSPYDNTYAQDYPHILITAGLNDPRVQYWEPTKWTAKLRDVKTDDNLLLLKVHMGAGHFSSSGRYDYLKDIAFEYAFILDVFGITN